MRSRGSELLSVAFDDADGGHHRATAVVATSAVCDHVVRVAVFLGGEGAGHSCGCKDLVQWGGPTVELSFVVKKEGDVLDKERMVARSCARVFSWTQKETKGDRDHVGCHSAIGSLLDVMSLSEDAEDKSDGKWLHSVWRFVNFAVGSWLPMDSEVFFACSIASEIFGPHPGVRLTHGLQCALHSSRLDGDAAGCQPSISVTLAEDLEDWCWVVMCAEERVKTEVIVEVIPSIPMFIHDGSGLFNSDSGACCFLNKLEITAEFIHFQSRQSCHGSSC